jgi:hypothetical protein
MNAEKVTLERELLRLAYSAGQDIPYGDATDAPNNRAMELAFLAGLLGQGFDEELIKEEAVR